MSGGDFIKRIKSIKFDFVNDDEVNRSSFSEIYETKLFDDNGCIEHGLADGRLGCYSGSQICKTCKNESSNCPGHFGSLKPAFPLLNVGFTKHVMAILRSVCKNCGHLLLSNRMAKSHFRSMKNNPDLSSKKLQRKKILDVCKNNVICQNCLAYNGKVKKGTLITTIHEQFKPAKLNSSYDYHNHVHNVDAAKDMGLISAASLMTDISMDPVHVLNIFKQVSSRDFSVLSSNSISRPESLLYRTLPVPPMCIRPAVNSLQGDSREDDLTVKLLHILALNNQLKQTNCSFNDHIKRYAAMLYECLLMVNGNLSGLPRLFKPDKVIRSYFSRLKGKHARFRGNLSGKRVNFTGRTVISPDPYLRIDQVSIPLHMAKILTYPVFVTEQNIKQLRELVRRGPKNYPGATMIQRNKLRSINLNFGDCNQRAKELKVGDRVCRHLSEGDIVLFNRQPSLHRESIQAFYANIGTTRTLRFNECCCTPFNADFDGDEMNVHVPQTEQARTEAIVLMASTKNMISHKCGEPLTAGIQDFISGIHLLTRKDVFLTEAQMHRLIYSMKYDHVSQLSNRPLPEPAIIKPVLLWTGKQIVSYLLKFPPTAGEGERISLNLQGKGKTYSKSGDEFCSNDSYFYIDDGDVIAGSFDKNSLGSGSKSNIFYFISRNFGPKTTVDYISRVCRLAINYLMMNVGFTVTMSDVILTTKGEEIKKELFNTHNERCKDYIKQFEDGSLHVPPGFSPKDSLESHLLQELSAIRDEAGKKCLDGETTRLQSVKIMTCTGAKGSINNHCQMAAVVGQQAIMGHRAPVSYKYRSHITFLKHDISPMPRGFINNSFSTGLDESEFCFHMMAGREGLVDAAIKTAETGYMQRRMMKGTEDIYVAYDNTVRSCDGQIIQFVYGSDGFSPAHMEGNSRPIDFNGLIIHILNSCPDDWTNALSAEEFGEMVDEWDRSFTTVNEGIKDELREFIKDLMDRQAHHAEVFGKHVPVYVFPKIRRITGKQLKCFLDCCSKKFDRAQIEPGTAIGAITAQSIGEPATQMTLKAFHFTGLASMTITQGVPRIKEIINGMKNIKTPVIQVGLEDNTNLELVKRIKTMAESTRLGQISEIYSEFFTGGHRLVIIVDETVDNSPTTEEDMNLIIRVILASKVYICPDQIVLCGREIYISLLESTMLDAPLTIKELQQLVIKGVSNIKQAVIISRDNNGVTTYGLAVNGNSFAEVIAIPGVDGLSTKSNHVHEIFKHLGIEAARSLIIEQIEESMSSHAISLDRRHMMFTADTMTTTGEVRGMTIHGVAGSKEGTLTLASFERATDFLYDSAFNGKLDDIRLVSESIMTGQQLNVGTGVLDLVTKSHLAKPIFGKIISSEPPSLNLPQPMSI